jgi:hypothetical protein
MKKWLSHEKDFHEAIEIFYLRGSTKNFLLNTLRRWWMPPAISQVEDRSFKVTCLISAKCAEIKQTEPFAVRLATTGKAPTLECFLYIIDVSLIENC